MNAIESSVTHFENPFEGLSSEFHSNFNNMTISQIPIVSEEEKTLQTIQQMLAKTIDVFQKIYHEYANNYGNPNNIPEMKNFHKYSVYYGNSLPIKAYQYMIRECYTIFDLLNKKVFKYIGFNHSFDTKYPNIYSGLDNIYIKQFHPYYNKLLSYQRGSYESYVTIDRVSNASRKLVLILSEMLAVTTANK